jgi:DNA modification methylase
MVTLVNESQVQTAGAGRETRQRQKVNFHSPASVALQESIKSLGLINPLVVTRYATNKGEGYHEYMYTIVAGERRLRALREILSDEFALRFEGRLLEPFMIPVSVIENADDILLFEMELHENIIREDLDWKDRTRAVDDLHKLRVAQDPTHTESATAAELNPEHPTSGSTREEVSRAKIINEFMDDPDVSGASSANEAYKIASRKMEAEFTADLELRGLGKKSRHVLIHGECDEIMTELISEIKFDLIIADPPYGMGADEFGDAAKLGHGYKDDEATAFMIASNIFQKGYLLTKDDAHIYMFCDIDQFDDLRDLATLTGWKPFRTPIVWHKLGGRGHAPLGDRGLRRSYELILFASKGNKTFPNLFSDVMPVAAVHNKVYAAQKPSELYEQLIKQSCLPQSLVLDPTCGVGTIFRAAQAANCTGYGIELDKDTHDLALVALNEVSDGST